MAHRFDAMLVPGVRGEREFRYNNVVVLRHVDEWAFWVEQSPEPQLVNAGDP